MKKKYDDRIRDFGLGISISIFSPRTPAAPFTTPQAGMQGVELPAWVNSVGARRVPQSGKRFPAKDCRAVNDGHVIVTDAIQKAIDACSADGGGIVSFEPGTDLTGALFLKDNVHLRIGEGVTLRGFQDESVYPEPPPRWTRTRKRRGERRNATHELTFEGRPVSRCSRCHSIAAFYRRR